MKMEMLKDLYKALWLSADFESDFSIEWLGMYQLLRQEDAENIPDAILGQCYQWMLEWESKNGPICG